MKKLIVPFVGLIACFAIFVGLDTRRDGLVSMNSGFKIAERDMPMVIKQANLGRLDAMKKLALHYGMYDENYVLERYWQFRVAEAGDVEMRLFLVETLESSKIPKGRENAFQLRKKWNLGVSLYRSQ
ncbi:hypothetical protein [Chitinibacter tainanensis]|uniref:hypothetical protein n=1 Tax=Chitinibacter tainanensis TaxID=230667 RepID=UPI00048C1AE7|nr:hypothetical protein [Chitinibacter tainanensis]